MGMVCLRARGLRPACFAFRSGVERSGQEKTRCVFEGARGNAHHLCFAITDAERETETGQEERQEAQEEFRNSGADKNSVSKKEEDSGGGRGRRIAECEGEEKSRGKNGRRVTESDSRRKIAATAHGHARADRAADFQSTVQRAG